jgi:hypothetical protein
MQVEAERATIKQRSDGGAAVEEPTRQRGRATLQATAQTQQWLLRGARDGKPLPKSGHCRRWRWRVSVSQS